MKYLNYVVLLLLGSGFGQVQSAEWGNLEPAPLDMPGRAGPAHFSKVYIGETQIRNGTATVTLPVDAPTDAAVVFFDEQPLTARVPGDAALEGRMFRDEMLTRMDLPAVGIRMDLSSLRGGEHTLRLETARKDGRVQYALVQPNTPLELKVQTTPLAARPGDAVTITAYLDPDIVTRARVNAQIRGTGNTQLRDDGRDADALAGDGVYTGVFHAPKARGLRQLALKVNARGELSSGVRFARTGTSAVMVSASNTRIDERVTADSSGVLTIPLSGAKGKFRIEVIYARDGTALAWAREEVGLRNQPRAVMVPRPAGAAAANQAVIRVLNLDTLGLEDERFMALQPLAEPVPDSSGLRGIPIMLPAGKSRAATDFNNPGAKR